TILWCCSAGVERRRFGRRRRPPRSARAHAGGEIGREQLPGSSRTTLWFRNRRFRTATLFSTGPAATLHGPYCDCGGHRGRDCGPAGGTASTTRARLARAVRPGLDLHGCSFARPTATSVLEEWGEGEGGRGLWRDRRAFVADAADRPHGGE